jgi:hypothetical protein
MNTYNDNQLIAVKNILSAISTEQSKRESAQTVAQFNLYFAVGAQLLAQEKLNKVNADYDSTMAINNQGVANSNRANNLMESTLIADQNVTAVVTNTATVAQNVQAAANAVLKLAANIGSANNIVHATDYGTDIQRMTEYANKVISKTAYQAELTSQLAMESSTFSSQIISKQVLKEATTTKSLFDDMLSCTQSELNTLTAARITDTGKLASASTTQRAAEGKLSVAALEFVAVKEAYAISNNNLNYGLQVEAKANKHISVYFEAFEPPLERLEQEHQEPLDNKYYIAVVKADTKDSFTFDVAETRFNQYKDKRFVLLEPGSPHDIVLAKHQDIDGDAVKEGIPYVVVVYQELDNRYKKEINSFSDRMSAPSAAFTLTTTLPEVKELSGDKESGNGLHFKPASIPEAEVEYRCILLPANSLCQEDATPVSDSQETIEDSTDSWFNLAMAKQVAQVNYLLDKKIKGEHKAEFSVTITSETTDNFGKLLVDGETYIPTILSIVPDTAVDENRKLIANSYTPSLTKFKARYCKSNPDDTTNSSLLFIPVPTNPGTYQKV